MTLPVALSPDSPFAHHWADEAPAGIEPIRCAAGEGPPARARLWWTDPWTWGTAPGEWLPLALGAATHTPGECPLLAAPRALTPRALLGQALADTGSDPTPALVAFLAWGRGRRQGPLTAAAARQAVTGGEATALVAPPDQAPAGWWTFDPAAWWEKNALLPLVRGLLFRRPDLETAALAREFPPATPAHRESLRQLLLSAAELGLVEAALADLFLPASFGR